MFFLKELAEQFAGQSVVDASGNAEDIPLDEVKGKMLKEVKTYGKEILFCFPDFTIRIHLMLFGKFAINSTLNRALKLGLTFDKGEINFYACEVRFIREPLDEVYDWTADVLNSAFDKKKAFEKLRKHDKEIIADALLDQHILAGVGNKIKNEVLFRRQVHPQSLTGAIPDSELKRLVDECVKLSYEYLDWKRNGEDDDHWEVYKKKECPRDHVPILKEKMGRQGRSSYFCEKCQKLYAKDGSE